jgi:hypothetical protein
MKIEYQKVDNKWKRLTHLSDIREYLFGGNMMTTEPQINEKGWFTHPTRRLIYMQDASCLEIIKYKIEEYKTIIDIVIPILGYILGFLTAWLIK